MYFYRLIYNKCNSFDFSCIILALKDKWTQCEHLKMSVFITDAFMEFTSGILSVTGINATAHIFASYPARHLSVLGGFIDQVSSVTQ